MKIPHHLDGKTARGNMPQMLGRYHVLEALSEDGLGVLYLARLEGPKGFQRWASVRRMHPALSHDSALVHSFYEGARMAARINHPNVATTFDISDGDNPPWMAFEYMHGETVEDLIDRAIRARRPVPWDIACRVVSEAAVGLAAVQELAKAHQGAHVTPHEAVTPDRLIVTYDGKTKLFGACAPVVKSARSLAYTPPECIEEGGEGGVEGRMGAGHADVFALGTILWELLAGRRLFARDSEPLTLASLRALEVMPLRTHVRSPTKLDEIIQCALARQPGERFQSARTLARALQGIVVAKGLVLTDDDVARWLLVTFADRFAERQSRLLSAANVTEVLRREDLPALAAAPDTDPDPVLPPKPAHAEAAGADTRSERSGRARRPKSQKSARDRSKRRAAEAALRAEATVLVPRVPRVRLRAAPYWVAGVILLAAGVAIFGWTPRRGAAEAPNKPGLLTVNCVPECDDVAVDGTSRGASPVFQISVPSGPHRLTLRVNDPAVQKTVSVNVSPQDTTVVNLPMIP